MLALTRRTARSFLNRLLGVEVDLQFQLFTYFSDTFDARIAVAKSSGKWDDGVVSLKAESITACDGFPSRIHSCPSSGAETHVLKLALDRGVPFETAVKRLKEFEADAQAMGRVFAPQNGFYKSTYVTHAGGTDKPIVLFATEIWTGNVSTAHRRTRSAFRICRVRCMRCLALPCRHTRCAG